VCAMLDYMAHEAGVDTRRIGKISVAGNPTMTHLFLGIDPAPIAPAPYIAPVTGPLVISASEAGVSSAAQGAVITVLPAVAAYVGADAVAASLRVRLDELSEPAMIIDFGTNAEMILTDGEKLYACSAAAGPALEGAHIKCGMTARPGAIDRVDAGDDIEFTTIAGAPPEGMCGSGLLDVIAALVKTGVIDPSGKLGSDVPDSLPGKIRKRMKGSGADGEFLLHDPESGGGGRRVVLIQKDVREFQLAKGAIRAGAKLLLETAGLEINEIKTLYLAGALGTAARPESALAAGLVPDVPPERIKFAGNAALDGAADALLHVSVWKAAGEIARSINYIELSAMPEFTDRFVAEMSFDKKS